LGVVYAGLSGAVIALVVTAILAVLWNHLALSKYRLLRFRYVLSERRILWRFSAPAFLGGAIVAPVTWLGTVILLRTHDGYAQLGLFSAANQWRAAVAFLPAILGQATLPILSQVYGKGSNQHFYELLGVNMVITVTLSSLSAIAVVIGKPFILRAYGRGYESVSSVMTLMLITTVIISVGCVIGQALASAAEMWAGFWLNCAWALVFLACSVELVPGGGAVGLAKAFLVSYLVHGTILTGYSWFTLRTRKAQLQDALAVTA
jgi:O-antigen/teichoic acid export membrane protein